MMAKNLETKNFSPDNSMMKFTVVMVIFIFYVGDNEYGRGFYKRALFSDKSFICSIFTFSHELNFMKNINKIFYLVIHSKSVQK